MALSEFEIKRIEKLVGKYIEQRRPKLSLRDDFDISFRISGQSFEIFEIRSRWDDPSKKIEGSVAKATYIKKSKNWKLYWKRADMKWHWYEPFGESESLEEVLEAIDQDQYGCFWG
ncbi:DUF3024 domain-containing protein [Desulfobacula sp.]|uniref:DUF3024 domain-containing protein n=1 Tax=Desulfobacula sp. TaxID=2593537 RepID=UPI0025C6476C|nr:DUF3024 domain-containing protein [Desulfobacula sp.]MBC2703519.1 DUF3024 domain-containing protein [Desulfobacula sp.]